MFFIVFCVGVIVGMAVGMYLEQTEARRLRRRLEQDMKHRLGENPYYTVVVDDLGTKSRYARSLPMTDASDDKLKE